MSGKDPPAQVVRLPEGYSSAGPAWSPPMTAKTARQILDAYLELALWVHSTASGHAGKFTACEEEHCSRCRTLIGQAAQEIGEQIAGAWDEPQKS